MFFYIFIAFYFIWFLRSVKFILLILSRANGKNPEKKHLTTRKQNLACLIYDPSWARTLTSDLER